MCVRAQHVAGEGWGFEMRRPFKKISVAGLEDECVPICIVLASGLQAVSTSGERMRLRYSLTEEPDEPNRRSESGGGCKQNTTNGVPQSLHRIPTEL